MDKLESTSLDIKKMNIEKLKELFPNVVTEGKIDFDVLREVLGEDVDDSKEKYQFTWHGKRKSLKIAQASSSFTLRPDKTSSKDWDSTNNLYIEGDNLEVLKLLQKTYYNKVKMIYIDPPYNTGNDFIYNDNYSDGINNYKNQTNQEMSSNPDTSGRYHTKWLNLMYPRLLLAKNLLKNDGVIFISIDDSEQKNLKSICDEIFGETNFIAQLIWQNKKGGGNDSKFIAIEHEYILAYAKNINLLHNFYEMYSEDYKKRYKETDEEGKYYWDTFKRKSGKQYYPIVCPDGTVLQYDDDGNPISWLRSKKRFDEDIKKGEIRILKVGEKWSVQFKQRMPKGKTPRSIFTTNSVITEYGTTSLGASDMYKYFKKDMFSNPKPVQLIEFLMSFCVQESDIVLDFFSGSGTTGEAIFKANSKDNGNRKFILIQLPELCQKNTNAYNAGYKNICCIAKDRIHFAGEMLKQEYCKGNLFNLEKNFDNDTGFKVYKLDSTNIQPWDNVKQLDENTIFDYSSDVFKPDRTKEDILYEIMLKYGIFDQKVSEININNKTLYQVGRKYMIVCLEDEITLDDINAIAELQPKTVVFKESGFKNDNDKINAVYNLEKAGVEDIKCI